MYYIVISQCLGLLTLHPYFYCFLLIFNVPIKAGTIRIFDWNIQMLQKNFNYWSIQIFEYLNIIITYRFRIHIILFRYYEYPET